jgi:hypothetical protein
VKTSLIEVARRNQLLNGLSHASLARLAPDFELREVAVLDRIANPDEEVVDVHFPLTCVFSTVAAGAEGEMVEVATVGNEGMAGLSVFLGVDTAPSLETFAQLPGQLLWMRAKEFRAHLKQDARLAQIMGCYTQALLTQLAQSSACNRMHAADLRCARWLLMTHDRVGRSAFSLTQEFIAQMLGVRRATVSEIATSLQAASVIRYSRGTIEILDRRSLERRACECYRIIRSAYARLLPRPRGQ